MPLQTLRDNTFIDSNYLERSACLVLGSRSFVSTKRFIKGRCRCWDQFLETLVIYPSYHVSAQHVLYIYGTGVALLLNSQHQATIRIPDGNASLGIGSLAVHLGPGLMRLTWEVTRYERSEMVEMFIIRLG